jgi:hypothetical protein
VSAAKAGGLDNTPKAANSMIHCPTDAGDFLI